MSRVVIGNIMGFNRKNKTVLIVCISCLLYAAVGTSASATSRNKQMLSNVKSGVYIPSDLIAKQLLKNMPVPLTNEDYAFLQSIGTVTNVVIGEFAEGEQKITWIQDSDADGTVDIVSYYFPERKKIKDEPHPSRVITDEQFKKMKIDILNGKQEALSPNKEAIPPLKSMIEQNSDSIIVSRTRNGYSVRIPDMDRKSQTRITFMYSDNRVNGSDLVFDVAYRNVGETPVVPIIRKGVYCKNSQDKVVQESVRDLLEYTAEYYPHK